MLKLEVDCPYCQKPMKAHLQNLSPDGCHYLIPPYNSPEPSSYEGYLFTCGNGHAHITISASEYYFPQIAGYHAWKKAHDECMAAPTRHGYKPIGISHTGFTGTVRLDWLTLGYSLDKNKEVFFTATPGKTPYIYVYYFGNPYMEQFRIDCTEEWLSWSPDDIIEMMKLTMQKHEPEFNNHFEGCEEWDDQQIY